ncbi:MAG: type II toxin-antitoxin system VapC family toxin [Chloroflexi bacterium]|nr:type II toxin-antitoxin system VapC family toxin [Chloroflexota bacterium]
MVAVTHLLDTNTWIYALKGKPIGLVERLGKVQPTSVAFCSVVKAELLRGAYRYANRDVRFAVLQALFSRHQSFSFDDAAAEVYGHIRHELEISGQVIGAMDMLITAIALANDLILVTNNTAEFERISNLKLEDWTQPISSETV